MRNRQIYRDPPVPLTPQQEWDARYEARRSARSARNAIRTARGEYRVYRESLDAGPYLDWPRWRDEYKKAFKSSGVAIEPSDGRPPGITP